MQTLARGAETALLGTADRALVELVEKPGAPPAPARATGLYHVAFVVPERADLGSFLRRAQQARYPLQGASDHLVSEAIYLADPDGHGIEVYWDRPRGEWQWDGATVSMAVDPLDIAAILDLGAASDALPSGATIGHVHLRVADAERSERFYADTLGLAVTAHLPGASFVAADGYHHHFGLNQWTSRNGTPAPENTARLERVRFRHGTVRGEIVDPSGIVLEAVAGPRPQ